MKSLTALVLLAFPALAAFPNGYDNCKVVTTQKSMVSGASDLTNYPLTIVLTDVDLRTVANGGLVNDNSGFDIAFYPDCSGAGAALKWEIESYTPATGALVVHVLRPTLSRTVNDTVGMFYGGPFSSFQSTPSAVWAGYKSVWHLASGTSLRLSDSANANAATNNNSVTAAAAQLGYGGSFSGGTPGPSLSLPDAATVKGTGVRTYQGWFKGNQTSLRVFFNDGPESGTNYAKRFIVYLNATGKLVIDVYGDSYTGAVSYNDNIWHAFAVDLQWAGTPGSSAATSRVYVDGALITTKTWTGGGAYPNTGAGDVLIGNYVPYVSTAYPWIGGLDEFRYSSVVRSADWILTEYRNQSDPGAYISTGPRTTPAGQPARVRHSVRGGI